MTLQKLRWFQAIGELAIPLLGYFYFDWSLYFILLFYFIDLIVTEVFTVVKVNRIIRFQQINYPLHQRLKKIAVNSFLVLSLLTLSHVFIYYFNNNIVFWDEIWAFLTYEEPGFPVPQGIILFPLVFFGNYQQYTTFFVKMGLFRRFSWSALLRSRRRALVIAILGTLLAILLHTIFPAIPAILYLVVTLLVKFYVDVWLSP